MGLYVHRNKCRSNVNFVNRNMCSILATTRILQNFLFFEFKKYFRIGLSDDCVQK